MNTELEQLKDIHLPHAISMWPTAVGWLIIFALLSGLMACLVYFWYQRNKRKHTVRFALAKLASLRELSVENPESVNVAAEISTLIRRTALYYFHREKVAGLTGNDWLHFLNQSGNTTQFTEEAGRLLLDAPYRKTNTPDLTLLFDLTEAWLVTLSKKNGIALER